MASAIHEAEADPPLIVDRDWILSSSFSRQRMKSVARRGSKIAKAGGDINIVQFPSCPLRHVSRDTPALTCCVQLSSTTVSKRLDHRPVVTRHVTRGKTPCLPHDAIVEPRASSHVGSNNLLCRHHFAQHFGMTRHNLQQRFCCTRRLAAALLPLLQSPG